jgi:hypothetical protein
MQKSGFNVVVGTFQKNGIVYHAAITAPTNYDGAIGSGNDYRVLLSHPSKKTISFNLKIDETGRWIPDKRQIIDPWVADYIGKIIECKILGTQNFFPFGTHN